MVDIVVGTILGVLIASMFNVWDRIGGSRSLSGGKDKIRRIRRLEARLCAIEKRLQDFEDKAKKN